MNIHKVYYILDQYLLECLTVLVLAADWSAGRSAGCHWWSGPADPAPLPESGRGLHDEDTETRDTADTELVCWAGTLIKQLEVN